MVAPAAVLFFLKFSGFRHFSLISTFQTKDCISSQLKAIMGTWCGLEKEPWMGGFSDEMNRLNERFQGLIQGLRKNIWVEAAT